MFAVDVDFVLLLLQLLHVVLDSDVMSLLLLLPPLPLTLPLKPQAPKQHHPQ